mgnify:CR=1 FL=1
MRSRVLTPSIGVCHVSRVRGAMRSRRGKDHRTWHALRVLLAVMLVAMPLRAQPANDDLARRAFDEGVALEKKGDYAAALAKFRESMSLKATVGNRFHAAFCLEMTGLLASALDEYETVEKLAIEQKKTDVVAQTRARMEPLKARVPRLALTVAAPVPKDTEVLLDGKPVASAMLGGEPFRIDPGEHTITAHAPDRERFEKRVSIEEGATVSVEITLPPSPPATPSRPAGFTEPPKEEPRSGPPMNAILAAAGAVVLAGGGIAAYVIADGTHEEAKRTCPTRRSCEDERDEVRLLDTLALGGFVGAAALAVISVRLWTAKPDAASAPGPSVAVRPAPSGLRLEGVF